jgi:hypothetical protein
MATLGFARFDANLRPSKHQLKTQEHQQRRKYPASKGKNTLADTDSLQRQSKC